ncbi:MAG: ribonuclease III domain-containing protein [Clostridia bacterium]|nr:ribonuclease III domain-containing protein [Clostridia bacterium]
MKNFDIRAIEKTIGYTFKNKKLLFQAFTHSSFSNEMGLPSYERLEFVGDAAIGLVITVELYARFADLDEGKLSKARARLVSRQSFGSIIDDCGLIEYMQVGKGDIQVNALESVRKKCDLFEAIAGAILLDSGTNLDEVKKLVLKYLAADIERVFDDDTYCDYKSEVLEKYKNAEFVFRADGENFVVTLLVGGKEVASASSKSKKDAEKAAAKAFLDGKSV